MSYHATVQKQSLKSFWNPAEFLCDTGVLYSAVVSSCWASTKVLFRYFPPHPLHLICRKPLKTASISFSFLWSSKDAFKCLVFFSNQRDALNLHKWGTAVSWIVFFVILHNYYQYSWSINVLSNMFCVFFSFLLLHLVCVSTL